MKAKTLENTTRRIQRIGRIITIISRIVMIILLLSTIVHVANIVAILINEKWAGYVYELYSDNTLYKILFRHADMSRLTQVQQAAISCSVVAISQFALFLIVRLLYKFMHHLAKGGRPFDEAQIRRMRIAAFLSLLLCLYNFLMGLFAFGLVYLFTYIMEYGGYMQEKADETNRIQEDMIFSFAEITENKSGQTGQHIKRVSEYARVIAEQMKIPTDRVEVIRIASTMHDVGKLLIPGEILEKPGKLTDEEFAEIKKHTTYGGQLLENVKGDELQLSRTIALQHHERYDGHGYPSSLAGDDISIEGRIVAVADVYDALTSKRSYKDAWSEEDAYQEILKGKGSQFDPDVVDAFTAAHDDIIQIREQFA